MWWKINSSIWGTQHLVISDRESPYVATRSAKIAASHAQGARSGWSRKWGSTLISHARREKSSISHILARWCTVSRIHPTEPFSHVIRNILCAPSMWRGLCHKMRRNLSHVFMWCYGTWICGAAMHPVRWSRAAPDCSAGKTVPRYPPRVTTFSVLSPRYSWSLVRRCDLDLDLHITYIAWQLATLDWAWEQRLAFC